MRADDDAIDDWLDGVLTGEDRERFIPIWDDVAARYPDPDQQDERNAALSAAVRYLLGEVFPADFGREMGRINSALCEAKAAARAVALLAVDDGVSEISLHRELGVTRRTLRLWLGKDS